MSGTPKISLLHPTARVVSSAAFPRGWRDACESFFLGCDKPGEVEYIIAVHESRWFSFWSGDVHWDSRLGVRKVETVQGAKFIHFENFGVVNVVMNTGRDCVVDQINAAAAASTGDVLFGVMDDLRAPKHWDSLLLRALNEENCQVLQVGSGSPRDVELIVCGAVLRSYYETCGYALHPDFESMYADNYFTWEAKTRGALAVRLDLQFEHLHPALGKGMPDEVYASENAPEKYFNGRRTFCRLTGQPQEMAISVLMPGEGLRGPMAVGWSALWGYLMGHHRAMVMPTFGYTTNVYCTRIELARGVLENPIKSDYVLWIDDDNVLRADQFELLLADLREHPELDIVTGWCWCDNHQVTADQWEKWVMSCGRQDSEMLCKRFTPEDIRANFPLMGTDQMPDGEKFWSGFPVVLMRGSALERVGASAFAPIVRADVKYGFTGEDTAFFWRAHDAGLKSAVDFRVKVPHYKLRAIEPWVSGPALDVETAISERLAAVGEPVLV